MAPSLILNRRPQVPAEDSAAFGPIAERFRRAGDLERAVSLCRDGLQRFPHHISARVTLGWALLDLGKYDDARTELEQVLRRAPDNLAAIRGLAELHDRSEHTLHLPMDGPGQWPPDEATVNQAAADDTGIVSLGDPTFADEPVLLTVDDAPIVFESDAAQTGPSVLTPADLGLEMWSAAAPAEPVVSPMAATEPAVTPAASTEAAAESVATPQATEAAASEVAPIEEAVVVSAPVEHAVAPVAPVASVEEAVEPVSSVEMDDGVAPVPAIEHAAVAADLVEQPVEPESADLQWVVDEAEATATPVVSEADIAALIAEADKLEAAAETAVREAALATDSGPEATEAALVLDADVELDALDAVALDPPARGLHLVPPVEAEQEPADAVETVDALAPAEVVEAFAAAEVEAVAALAAVEAEDVDQQALDEEGLDVLPVAETADAELAVQSTAHAHIGEGMSMARAANVEEFRSPVAALERFLLKVQARRREVMTESVA